MIKLAVVLESSPFNRKGLFNAVHERVRHLEDAGDFMIDVFCLHSQDNAFTRRVRHTPKVPRRERVFIEGIVYNMLWYDFSITDFILTEKLHRKPYFFSRFLERSAALLMDYDIIAAHSYGGALLAHEAYKRYGVKYYVTWHGSDIHTKPWSNPYVMEQTKMLAEDAVMNFFVGQSLMEIGKKIAPESRSAVLCNGVSDAFRSLSPAKREEIRRSLKVGSERKVVAYVGSFQKVKNVLSLPEIFGKISVASPVPVTFWVIGDGKQRRPLLEGMVSAARKYMVSLKTPWRTNALYPSSRDEIVFWGNVDTSEMPMMMGCVDVLVIPSLNEGSPLVCAEAMRCGAGVAGADVCGIPDMIGRDYVAAHGENFAVDLARKVVDIITNGSHQSVPEQYDWFNSAKVEATFLDTFEKEYEELE